MFIQLLLTVLQDLTSYVTGPCLSCYISTSTRVVHCNGRDGGVSRFRPSHTHSEGSK